MSTLAKRGAQVQQRLCALLEFSSERWRGHVGGGPPLAGVEQLACRLAHTCPRITRASAWLEDARHRERRKPVAVQLADVDHAEFARVGEFRHGVGERRRERAAEEAGEQPEDVRRRREELARDDRVEGAKPRPEPDCSTAVVVSKCHPRKLVGRGRRPPHGCWRAVYERERLARRLGPERRVGDLAQQAAVVKVVGAYDEQRRRR
mmetsp:Transcript_20299/g.46866  ORF Transcript_20299/g.46866 Transcript_20299/m.46866 type:complete len:206 (-) Transcript_20299:163-780(-)